MIGTQPFLCKFKLRKKSYNGNDLPCLKLLNWLLNWYFHSLIRSRPG
uniref:Uncharacterized protein n=1 Tax=Arundo donax TaxID=35708 RepID=A0A0A9BD99_ARUDO